MVSVTICELVVCRGLSSFVRTWAEFADFCGSLGHSDYCQTIQLLIRPQDGYCPAHRARRDESAESLYLSSIFYRNARHF